MSREISLASVKVGDQVEAFLLTPFGLGTVAAVNHDGTVSLEHERSGKYIEDETGSYMQLGGGEPGEFVTTHCRARAEMLADGTRRFIVRIPDKYLT